VKVRRRLVVAAAAAAASVALAACGEEDFPNEPRPPAPIDLAANITDREVILGTEEVGAGLINVTVSNQSNEPAELTFDGPTLVNGPDLPPGTVGSVKANFEEGEYEVSGGEDAQAKPTILVVGPERPSSQNELLLP